MASKESKIHKHKTVTLRILQSLKILNDFYVESVVYVVVAYLICNSKIFNLKLPSDASVALVIHLLVNPFIERKTVF